jgi:TolB-like protein
MAYLEGRTLKELAAERPLPVEQILDIAAQAAAGLGHAHAKGFVHRDVKSANIMVAPGGRVTITDFGLAKQKGQADVAREATTVGTIAYMSPEQTEGADVDHRSDIWSLGVVLYELATRTMPFGGDYDEAIIYSILNTNPEPIAARRPGLPDEIGSIVMKAMAKDPEARYQSADEMLSDLKAQQTQAVAGVAGEGMSKKVHFRALTGWVLGTAVAVTLAFQAVGFFSRGPEAAAVESIAVFPFENIRANPEEDWLARDLAEVLTYQLSKLPTIRVIDRLQIVRALEQLQTERAEVSLEAMSLRASGDLAATMSLVGSYRTYGDSIRVTSRLVETETSVVVPLLQETYARSDVTAMQRDVVGRIVRRVSERAGERSTE